MNIFYLSKNTKKCARAHCDKHVVKMILKYTRLLFGPYYEAISEEYPETEVFGGCPKVYKYTHKNHPCALWVKLSSANWNWLLDLATELCIEYRKRYNRTHACEEIIEWMQKNKPVTMSFKVWQDPPQCFGPFQDTCFIEGKAKKAYRKYYALGKSHILVYTNRKKPKWLEQALEKQSK